MDRLTQSELRAVLDFLRVSYACPDLDTFQTCVVSSLPRLVRSEITAYNDVKPQFEIISRPSIDVLPDGPKIHAWFAAHHDRLQEKHPLVAYWHRTDDGSAVKISDFLTRREFRRTELFSEVFMPLRMEHQLAISLQLRGEHMVGGTKRPTEVHAPPCTTIGVVVMRDRQDFSERERLMMNLVFPHLAQAYRNARALGQMRQELAALSQALEQLPFGVIMLQRDGHISAATARAHEMLATYFDGAGSTATRLPDELARWMRHEQAAAGAIDRLYRPRRPFVVKREGRRLIVRALCDGAQPLLLLEEQVTALHPAMLEPLGLTRREAQVLVEVIRGKTNREVAAGLGMSPRTVGTHLDHIFQKLGVATRTAAVRRALDAVVAHGWDGSAASPSTGF